MKELVYYCDVGSCKKKREQAQVSFSATIGWISDPAGGPATADLLPLDLCNKHASGLIQILLDKLEATTRLTLIKKLLGE